MQTLFPEMPSPIAPLPAKLPPGFVYEREFLTLTEERELIAHFAELELEPAAYHEYTARRKTASFGLGAGFVSNLATPRQPAPDYLQALAEKVALHFGLSPRVFPHALVTEYPPGAPIGWHRDAPPFARIYGVSLGSDCSFRLRPHIPGSIGTDRRATAGLHARESVIKLTAERRSLYLMAGPSRSHWEHSIPPVKETRYSVTLRSL